MRLTFRLVLLALVGVAVAGIALAIVVMRSDALSWRAGVVRAKLLGNLPEIPFRELVRWLAPGSSVYQVVAGAALTSKTRYAALEHAAHQEFPELALDELRQARSVAGLRHRAQESLQV